MLIEIPIKVSSQETFDIIIIIIVHLMTVNKERFDIIRTKKLIEICRKRGEIIYLCKGVDVVFFYYISSFTKTSRILMQSS